MAAAAASVLGALYFVPSASATTEPQPAAAVQDVSPAGSPQLAETGSIDTTPYLVGGTGFLGVGTALLINAGRRSRAEDAAEDEDAESGAQA